MYNKWVVDKELIEKSKIYGDLKQLAINRDKHHELEEAMGLNVKGSADNKAINAIVANGKAALAICKKNGWGDQYISNLTSNIAQFNASGNWGTSDAIGNIIHNILINELKKLGEYGNCSTQKNLADVNAGALSYCEGTLKGTTTLLEGGGSQPLHKVAPKQYKSIIIDENPKGGYDIHVPIETGFWSKELADYLESKFGFDCKSQSYGSWKAGKICNVHIDSHDKIRLLAIFISNLKGGSEAIGKECVPLAMKEAWMHAEAQAKKGTMAFTQEPIIESQKQWIDKCYKTYGIMPPGLTEEQKTLMQLIGPDKIYAGCDLSTEETVPNMGIINYCEGVRTNPQAVVSATLTPQGNLAHYFHAQTDKLADIVVNPLEAGQYEVLVKNIDMRETALTNEVIKRLKAMNYTCQGQSCSKEITGQEIRQLAMLLSSLHQAYKLPASQVPQAVDLAISKITALPNDKNAYKHKVSPYTLEDWKKELGEAPATVKKGQPAPVGFKWKGPIENIQITDPGANFSIPKKHILKLVDAGFTKQQIAELLSNEEAWTDVNPYAVSVDQANQIADKMVPEVTQVILGKPLKGVIQPPVPVGKVYPVLDWKYINSLPTKGKKPWDLAGCVSYVNTGPTKIKLGYCAG